MAAGAGVLVRDALDLVLGSRCAGCGTLEVPACRACLALLERPERVRPVPAPAGLPPVTACATYEGPVRELLLAHKEHARLALAAPLGRALAAAVGAALDAGGSAPAAVTLVPVPSRPGSARVRGHDPLLRTTRAAAGALRRAGRSVAVAPVLVLGRRVRDSAGLTADDRWANLHRAVRVRPALLPLLHGRTPVLVDDVVTTGATLAEAARALCAAGVDVPAAAVLAATRRRRMRWH